MADKDPEMVNGCSICKDPYKAGDCPECSQKAVSTWRHIGAPVICADGHMWFPNTNIIATGPSDKINHYITEEQTMPTLKQTLQAKTEAAHSAFVERREGIKKEVLQDIVSALTTIAHTARSDHMISMDDVIRPLDVTGPEAAWVQDSLKDWLVGDPNLCEVFNGQSIAGTLAFKWDDE
jgi:hypothetical protein